MNLTRQTEIFVKNLLSARLSADISFHNLQHAQDVATAVAEIGSYLHLPAQDMNVLIIAAWLHDTGYCYEYVGHEQSSVDIAGEFLTGQQCDNAFIGKVLECIWSTRFPQTPKSLFEQIICDADLYHLSKEDYPDYEKRLRNEWSRVLHKNYKDREWQWLNLELLISHHYHTAYGRIVLEPRKQININRLTAEIAVSGH